MTRALNTRHLKTDLWILFSKMIKAFKINDRVKCLFIRKKPIVFDSFCMSISKFSHPLFVMLQNPATLCLPFLKKIGISADGGSKKSLKIGKCSITQAQGC